MKNAADPAAALGPYAFDLPPELIARRPAPRRDQARLLVMDRASGQLSDRLIKDLPLILGKGDLLVRNTTRVSHRRLKLARASGAKIETLFLKVDRQGPNHSVWRCLVKHARRLREGELLRGPDPELAFRFSRTSPAAEPAAPASAEDDTARFLIEVLRDAAPAWQNAAQAEAFFARYGAVPLPPYLKRSAEGEDAERYQTVYAGAPGSVAAPTAGLHFTPELERRLADAGVELAGLELLIGYGTFAPLSARNFAENALHAETYVIPDTFPTERWTGGKGDSGRRIAVGTTTLRALEDVLRRQGAPRPGTYETRLFLKPPDRCRSVEGLLTNFHLPASSLLLLVAAFGGRSRVLQAYRHAIAERYRFYSYGDAMLIV